MNLITVFRNNKSKVCKSNVKLTDKSYRELREKENEMIKHRQFNNNS